MDFTQAQGMQSVKELRDLWRQVSRQHLALGASCSCGFGFSIGIADLEADICDFIENKVRAEFQGGGICDALRRGTNESHWSLDALFRELETTDDAEGVAFICTHLTASLTSFTQAHRRASFVCN